MTARELNEAQQATLRLVDNALLWGDPRGDPLKRILENQRLILLWLCEETFRREERAGLQTTHPYAAPDDPHAGEGTMNEAPTKCPDCGAPLKPTDGIVVHSPGRSSPGRALTECERFQYQNVDDRWHWIEETRECLRRQLAAANERAEKLLAVFKLVALYLNAKCDTVVPDAILQEMELLGLSAEGGLPSVRKALTSLVNKALAEYEAAKK